MTGMVGAELTAELRRIAALVPTSDAGVAMLAAAAQLDAVREWAERNAERDPGDLSRDTDFAMGYRYSAEHARWVLGGPQPAPLHRGSDWPDLAVPAVHFAPWGKESTYCGLPVALGQPRRNLTNAHAQTTCGECRSHFRDISRPRGWSDPLSNPLGDIGEAIRQLEEGQ